MSDDRQEFEEWAEGNEINLSADDDHNYWFPSAHFGWLAWQEKAARAKPCPQREQWREDAERWQEVSRRFRTSKTSASEAVLWGIGLPDADPVDTFEKIIDNARRGGE